MIHDMSHMEPSRILNHPTPLFDQSKTIYVMRREKRENCGIVTPYRDAHGNIRYYATSRFTDEEKMFWSFEGAEWWCKISA